ncbi:DUF1450 domain-containing protein [Paenibacillus sp. y28]|uniref:DUF1450 domain-containing protein n=1 Tax=Paenibacillus sp. y28 TaxID=3129110 RepID=UPI0030172C3F
MKLRYCCKNMKQGTKLIYKKIEKKFPDIKQKKKDCLGCCKMCSKQCVVSFGKNKKLVRASTADELYKQLKELLA